MNLSKRYQNLIEQIQQTEQQLQRSSGSLKLIAVSKTFPAGDIRTLYQAGQRDFGENYIQEWQQKTEQLADCTGLIWHIIGNVQSNKSRAVAEKADWLHTLDRFKLAHRLNEQRPEHLPPLNVCIEINIGAESGKHGIAPEQMLTLAEQIICLPKLCLRGLMCVPPADIAESGLRRCFQNMQHLLAQLQTVAPQADTLSMGMSGDWQLAAEYGAGFVRIGSAIFGRRDYPV